MSEDKLMEENLFARSSRYCYLALEI